MFKKLKRICVLLFSACLILGCSVSSYADTYDHLLSGDVGEFITSADDEFPMRNARSSIATIENTVKWIPDLTTFRFRIVNEETGITSFVWKYLTEASDSQARIKYSAPDGYYIKQVNMYNVYNGNYSHSPDPGTYNVELDVTSQFSNELLHVALYSQRRYDNANTIEDFEYFYPETNSGDFYLSDINLTISSGLYRWGFYWYFQGGEDGDDYVYDIDYTIRQRFEIAEPTDENIKLTPSGISSSDSTTGYQDNVSSSLSNVNSSLSNISSSMADNAESIEEVADAIDALRGAMEPHYDNVLTQLHHVTEQLHALWDQQYNLHHVPLMSKLGDIITAIQTMDVNITVDVDGLKSTINTMSTNIQNKLGSVQTALTNKLTSVQTGINNKLQNVQDGINTKLQNVTDHITGGYDNSSLESDKSELDDALSQYEVVENELFDDAKEHINDFEFDTPLDSFAGPLADVSYFLSGMFSALGPMNAIISFSLTLTIAMVMIGWYRFKGGR